MAAPSPPSLADPETVWRQGHRMADEAGATGHCAGPIQNAESHGFQPHPMQQFFFEKELSWDLVYVALLCVALLSLSQVSSFLSCIYM